MLRQELDKVKYDYSTLVIIDKQLNQQIEEVTADRAKLLESSIAIKSKLERQVQEVRSQLAAEQTRFKELEEQCDDYEKWCKEEEGKVADRDKIIAELRSTTARELPDVYDVLNRVKAEDPKSKLTPGDIKRIYRILKES